MPTRDVWIQDALMFIILTGLSAIAAEVVVIREYRNSGSSEKVGQCCGRGPCTSSAQRGRRGRLWEIVDLLEKTGARLDALK